MNSCEANCTCQKIMVKYSGSCQWAMVPLTSISHSELCSLRVCCCCMEASVTVVTFSSLLFYIAHLAVMDGWILKPSAAAINIIFQCVYFHKLLVTAVWAELFFYLLPFYLILQYHFIFCLFQVIFHYLKMSVIKWKESPLQMSSEVFEF